jgi:CheY-like chemotaxis protein
MASNQSSPRYCILCVDDDVSGLEARAALLKEEGYCVTAVSRPMKALVLAYERDVFPRSASDAAEADRNLKLCFDDNAPQIDLFTSHRSVK